MAIDYPSARALLNETFEDVLARFLDAEDAPAVPEDVQRHCRRMFESKTQAYRETLLGALLAKLQDPSIDVRKPYMNMGEGAYNGRTMDENVVNPFLHEQRIPSSKGPYLSVFRRSVAFDENTRAGVRDKDGFDAMLACIAHIESSPDQEQRMTFLRHLLHRFIELREASNVPLSRLQRYSVPQYDALIQRLLSVPSGGRFPMFLIIAAFKAISDRFALGWQVEYQGINVADSPSGAGGDISVSSGDSLLMAAEVTERVVDKDRVISTFNTKIAPASIADYLFFVNHEPDDRVRQQCERYFAQGHEVNFVQIATWLSMMLTTIGKAGRDAFNAHLLELLEEPSTPQSVRAAWNDCVASLVEDR